MQRSASPRLDDRVIVAEMVGVTKQFSESDRVVVDGVSLSIAESELVALEGRSGSGKSTLLNLMAGVLSPDAGSVELFGRCLGQASESERARMRLEGVGFVFQDFNLLPELRVVDNVAMPALLAGQPPSEVAERATALLERVGLAHLGDQMPSRLSGGEQQRVAVARALIMNPPLVLADEPTGNLDWQSGQEVIELLLQANRNRASVVVATHDRDLASRCQRSLRIADGRLSEALVESTPEPTAPMS